MADSKLSDLSDLGRNPVAGDLVYVADGVGTQKKSPVSEFLANVLSFATGVISNAQHGARDSVNASHSAFAEGATHYAGFVPDPGATPGTTKFLREDASFVAPPGTPHALLDGTIDNDTLAAGPTAQDLIVANATPKWARLAAGTLNQVLGMAAGPVVQWLTLLKAHLPATVVYSDQANAWSSGAQDMGAAASLILPKAAGAAPTADGDLRFDTTREAFVGGRGDVSLKGFIARVLSAQLSTTDTLTNSTAALQVFATVFQLPANFFIANKCVRVTLGFEYTAVATVPSYTYGLRLEKSGPVDVSLWTTATMTPSATAKRGFAVVYTLQCATTGAAGTIMCHAIVNTTVGGALRENTVAQPVTFDTTSAQTIQATITFGATGSNNPVTLEQMIVEELN